MRFKHHFTLYIIVVLFSVCGLVSCDKAQYSGPPNFTLYLEDGPADYGYLRTSLESIELQHADGTWKAIKEPYTMTFDILLLSGGQMLPVADQQIAAGKYVKLRVTFSDKGAELGEGTVNTKLAIKPDSRVQEFAIDMTAADDLESYLILDINAATSVTAKQGSEGVRYFAPVCKIVNDEGLGTLWGMIGDNKGMPIAETMLVTVRRSLSNEESLTYTNRNTAAIFQRLAPGTYDMTITPGPTSKYIGTTVKNISINAGQSNQMGMIRLGSVPQK